MLSPSEFGVLISFILAYFYFIVNLSLLLEPERLSERLLTRSRMNSGMNVQFSTDMKL